MRSYLISRKGVPVTQGIPEGLKSSVSGVADEDQILEQKIPITPVTQEIMSFGGSNVRIQGQTQIYIMPYMLILYLEMKTKNRRESNTKKSLPCIELSRFSFLDYIHKYIHSH